MGLADLAQVQDPVHQRRYLAAIQQRRHLVEARPLAHEKDAVQRLVLDLERGQVALGAEDRREPPEGFRGRDALHDGRAAHAVEDGVDAGPVSLFQATSATLVRV